MLVVSVDSDDYTAVVFVSVEHFVNEGLSRQNIAGVNRLIPFDSAGSSRNEFLALNVVLDKAVPHAHVSHYALSDDVSESVFLSYFRISMYLCKIIFSCKVEHFFTSDVKFTQFPSHIHIKIVKIHILFLSPELPASSTAQALSGRRYLFFTSLKYSFICSRHDVFVILIVSVDLEQNSAGFVINHFQFIDMSYAVENVVRHDRKGPFMEIIV